MMEKNLDASKKRAVQYWFADGLVELSSGVICLLLAIYFIFQQIVPTTKGSFLLIFIIVGVAGFGVRKLMLWVRQRTTYPRTGFVEPRWEDRRILGVSISFSVLLFGFMLFTVLRGLQTTALMPALGGVIFAFIFSMSAFQTKLMRFFFLAGFSLLLGAFLALNGLGDLRGAGLLSLGTGLVLFAFGIVTRLAYLHQTSVIVEQTDEH